MTCGSGLLDQSHRRKSSSLSESRKLCRRCAIRDDNLREARLRRSRRPELRETPGEKGGTRQADPRRRMLRAGMRGQIPAGAIRQGAGQHAGWTRRRQPTPRGMQQGARRQAAVALHPLRDEESGRGSTRTSCAARGEGAPSWRRHDAPPPAVGNGPRAPEGICVLRASDPISQPEISYPTVDETPAKPARAC